MKLELQTPLLLLLQASSLPFHLPANLALLRRDILSLALDRPRQAAARLGDRHLREDHHEDSRNNQSHDTIVAPKGSASSKTRGPACRRPKPPVERSRVASG
jgi:hypothetical protein